MGEKMGVGSIIVMIFSAIFFGLVQSNGQGLSMGSNKRKENIESNISSVGGKRRKSTKKTKKKLHHH